MRKFFITDALLRMGKEGYLPRLESVGLQPLLQEPRQIEYADHSPSLSDISRISTVPLDLDAKRYIGLSNELKELLADQAKQDLANEASPPLLEFPVEITNKGIEVQITEWIYKSFQSSVFFAGKTRVVKYQSDCDNEVIHPILKESWALKAVMGSGLVPVLLAVSPAVSLPLWYTSKTGFEMTPAERKNCRQKGGVVRYIVTERLRGTHLGHLIASSGPHKRLSVHDAVELGIKLIEGLRVFHDQFQVVHGDIHAMNVMVDDDWNIKFIDFGRSKFGHEVKDDPIRAYGQYVHCYFGLHESMGYEESFRDDLFRAIQMIAYMMNGRVWMDRCMSLNSDPDRLMDFKENAFIFDVPGTADVIGIATKGVVFRKLRVRKALAEVLSLVRGIKKASDRPSFERIDYLLKTVLVDTKY